jgi:hypothetical protein
VALVLVSLQPSQSSYDRPDTDKQPSSESSESERRGGEERRGGDQRGRGISDRTLK